MSGSVEILANKSVAKALKKVGKPGGLPRVIQDSLVKKLSDPAGVIEAKGRGFYGVNLGAGCRTIFTLNKERKPVLIFVGGHKDYDRISNELSHNADKIKESHLSEKPVTAKLSSKKVQGDFSLAQFTEKFLSVITTGITPDKGSPAIGKASKKPTPHMQP